MSDESNVLRAAWDPSVPHSGKTKYASSRGGVLQPFARNKAIISNALDVPITDGDIDLAESIVTVRPMPLRDFDQIPMRTEDHIRQAKLIIPHLAGKKVAFIGDFDCASLMISVLGLQMNSVPSRILIVDFDGRLLHVAQSVAKLYGFESILETRLYN